jgi:hypothetical protein
MSGDVSMSQSPSESPRGEAGGLFTAFQEQQKVSRGRWVAAGLAILMLAVIGAGFWAVVKPDQATYRLVTPFGIKALRGGMTTAQVVAELGEPIALEKDATGAECYRYGRPTLAQPTFLVYSVCYEGGKLRDVTSKQYQAWSVDPEKGTFDAPAEGTPPGDAPAPAPASKG